MNKIKKKNKTKGFQNQMLSTAIVVDFEHFSPCQVYAIVCSLFKTNQMAV